MAERETGAFSWVFSARQANMGPELPVRLKCCLQTEHETPPPQDTWTCRGKTCIKGIIMSRFPQEISSVRGFPRGLDKGE